MSAKKAAPEDVTMRKKRLVKYGLLVVVAVAFAVSLIISWIVLMPGGNYLGRVILYTVLSTVGAAILCIIVWYIYDKLILKQ
ncbi:MAG: hypothetical protein JXM73_05600 [Anaerolineae bacterium]|nr:hypothetical protein [Anaerolineae bacterium]